MSITINEIKEKVHFQKKEQAKAGTNDIALEKLVETPDGIGFVQKIDADHDLTIMAGYSDCLDTCLLIGHIPADYPVQVTDIKELLCFYSYGRSREKPTIAFQGESGTTIVIRIDEEVVENIVNWFSAMFLACALPVSEFLPKSWEN